MRVLPWCLLLAAGCSGPRSVEDVLARPASGPEAVSLLGVPLSAPEFTEERHQELLSELQDAVEQHDRDSAAEDSWIWLGRRLAYLGRYRDAIEVYSRGLERHPTSYRLLRHRGHRYLTLRRFDDAIADLRRAAELVEGVEDELEADGAPNAFHVPRSTNHSNIFYHLGLAHYLKGELERARIAYERCMRFSRVNDDMLCATTYWLCLTMWKLKDDAAVARVLEPIREDMQILENHEYHRLLVGYRKGALDCSAEELGGGDVASATLGYGMSEWLRHEGRVLEADALLKKILEGETWQSFGFIAAEAEISRHADS